MMKAVNPSAQSAGQNTPPPPPVSKSQQQSGYASHDTVTRGPAPASMNYAAPAPQQTFERNALKAPSCPGLCWPQDEDCCYVNKSAARICCIKIGK